MKSPGEIFRWQVLITVSGVLTVIVVGLTILYSLVPVWRPVITFLGASIGIAAGVMSAFYLGRALRITIAQRNRKLREEEIKSSFIFAGRWNDPNFGTLRAQWRELLEELATKNPDEICALLKTDRDKRTVTADILNFFEEMAYAARSGAADISTLKNVFKSVTIRYFSIVYPWIEDHRTEKHQPTLYEHLQWLSDLWRLPEN